MVLKLLADVAVTLSGPLYAAYPEKTSNPEQKRVSDMMAELNRAPDRLKWMADGGFEVVDIPFDKSAAFMKELTVGYLEAAKRMGLLKSATESRVVTWAEGCRR